MTIAWIALAGLFLAAIEAQALTDAGTEIRNQSVATYKDAAGRERVSTSNEVISTVAPIYALQITPNQTGTTAAPNSFSGTAALSQRSAPGNTVYYRYYLQNQGNAADTYNLTYYISGTGANNRPDSDRVYIYQDINGDGQVDPGDRLLVDQNVTSGDFADGDIVATLSVDPGSTIGLILAYKVPASSTSANTLKTDLDARSNGDTTQKDAVGNWNETSVTDRGILTVSKSASVTSVAAGGQISFTVSGSNVGNGIVYGRAFTSTDSVKIDLDASANGAENRTGVLITDVLPSELDPATLSVVSFSPSNATVVYQVSGEWRKDSTGTVTGIGLFIPDSTSNDLVPEAALSAGQGYSLVFSVTVKSNVTNTSIVNNADVYYRDDTDDQAVKSNDAIVVVGGPGSVVPAVDLGPSGDPEYGDNDEGQNVAGAKDTVHTSVTGLAMNAGTSVTFTQTVKNNGNSDDVMDITIIGNTVPSSTVTLLKADGITPLADTDRDGIPDVGTLAPGASATFYVKVFVAANAAAATGDFYVQARATTSNVDATNSRDTNDTWDVIGDIRPAAVDIAQNGQIGDGDNSTGDDYPAAVTNWTPGEAVDFVLDVANVRTSGTVAERTTGATDTYNLSISGLPSGWAANIYIDANGNGTLDNSELVPVTNTSDLDPYTSGNDIHEQIIVRVFVPDTASAGSNNITVTATSTNLTSASDFVVLTVSVKEVPAVQIIPDNSGVAVRGGTITYRHVVTNVGNVADDFQLTAVSAQGWSFVFVKGDGTTVGTSPLLTTGYGVSGSLGVGASQEVFIKVFVPANATVGYTDVLTVTVTGVTKTTATDSAVDSTTVIDGNLQLTKEVSPTGAVKPTLSTVSAGADYHKLTYTVKYENLGAAAVTVVEVIDAVPANTRIVLASDGTLGAGKPIGYLPSSTFSGGTALTDAQIQFSTDNGSTWTALSSATTNADKSNPNVTHIKFVIGTVGAGEKGLVAFQVLIN